MKIMVTLDGSHFSESILGSVADLARSTHAHVELVTVGKLHKLHEGTLRTAAPEVAYAGAPMINHHPGIPGALEDIALGMISVVPGRTLDQEVERVESELDSYLRAQTGAMGGVHVSTRVLLADDPAQAIIDYARHERPDMIAMATHGRTGVSHMIMGSVCERVLRSGVAPVLAMRPAE